MSQPNLTYCCSNPECHTKFSVDQAEQATGLVQQTAGLGMQHPFAVSLVHLLCPNCKTIAASIHVPSDPI